MTVRNFTSTQGLAFGVLSAMAMASWGCSDPAASSSTTTSQAGNTGFGGGDSQMSAVDAGVFAGGGQGGIGLTPLTDAGPAIKLDAGTASASNPLALPQGCPTIQALPVAGQDWAVVAVNFSNPEVIFQNVSSVEQTLTTDHQWCLPTTYQRVIAFDVNDPENLQAQVFQPGDIVRAPLADSDLRTNLIDVEAAGGEMALYPSTGNYADSSRIMAYVSWGTGQPLGVITRDITAEGAGLWSLGDHVPIAPGHIGIVAIGPTDVSEGYVSVSANCYPK